MLYQCGLYLLPFDTFDILESVASPFFRTSSSMANSPVVIKVTDTRGHLVRALFS